MFQTEHEFTLPLGYLDAEGTLHREGVMRLATAADEILPLKDPRVQRNTAYLTVLLLSRVVTRLGGVEPVTPNIVEGLFAADLAYLQALYNEVNRVEESRPATTCPNCAHRFVPEEPGLGESPATPSPSFARR
jgi:hypothetical protein